MKKTFTKDNIQFDSREELLFYRWCKEAKEAGYLRNFNYHPEPFKLSERVALHYCKQLKTKIKEVEKFLLHPHEYTADFTIEPHPVFDDFSHGLEMRGDELYFIDVKGGFNLYNNHREFSINQKWVYEKYGIFINKVEPEKFFAKTWRPGNPPKKTWSINV